MPLAICRTGLVASCALGLLACSAGPQGTATPTPGASRPTLLVFISVDQLRPDYLEKFGPQLTGGLARFRRNGAVFSNAHQDYAITETAPGHASLMSGRFPRSTGITRNIMGVNDRAWPLLAPARDLGAAPARFRGTTLTDWLAAANPATRVLSASTKDRSAILMIGRSKQNVYWLAANHVFTTSTWYRDSLPDWVKAFNALRIPQSYAGKSWTPLLPDAEYPEPDSVPVEGNRRTVTFPHLFSNDSNPAANQMRFSPGLDQLTLRFALEGFRRLDLGRGPVTDVLAISFSGTDYIGHYYGPESKEQHDHILQLDRTIGALIDTLYQLRDSTRIIFALSADHGGGFIPELHGRRRVSLDPALGAAGRAVKEAGGDSSAVDLESGAFFVDPAKLAGRIPVDSVVSVFIRTAKAIPGVLRADRWKDFARADTTADPIARRWLHMFPDDMLPVAAVTLEPGDIYNYPIIATHGSPHDYDSNVPIMFYGPPFKPGVYDRFVRTADIAPTLARVLGVTPTERLDGQVLPEAIR